MTSAGSMSPSDGTLANTNTRITAKDATFISRTLLNGKSNSYGAVILQEKYNGVTADFTNCELRAVDGLDPLINATQLRLRIYVRMEIRSHLQVVRCLLWKERIISRMEVTDIYMPELFG